VYDHPHIGNFRYFVWVDVLHRYLAWKGYDVELVMNLTDVDDKIIGRAAEAGTTIDALTEEFVASFQSGLETLRIRKASAYPRATAHIPEMIELVQRLLEANHAYQVEGNVFFRVSSFDRYGQLANLDPDEMQATERVGGDDFAKEDPRDFALWKESKPDEPGWPAPFGTGRPGWHLECSAMSMDLFGPTFDMHLGGADLMFPHHENEIAQSEAATGEPFVRHWMHCQHLIVDGAKMSKSVGNFRTLEELAGEGHDPVALRFLLASVHYRRQLNLTAAALEQAQASVQRLRDASRRVDEALVAAGTVDIPRGDEPRGLLDHLKSATAGFAAALDDDLNTAGALGHLFTFVRELNTTLNAPRHATLAPARVLTAVRAWFDSIDEILCVFAAETLTVSVTHEGALLEATGPPVPAAISDLVLARIVARRSRDFARADELRDALAGEGIEVEDTATGGRWKKAAPKA